MSLQLFQKIIIEKKIYMIYIIPWEGRTSLVGCNDIMTFLFPKFF